MAVSGDVSRWLNELGLVEYAAVFAENGVDFRSLPKLTEQDLKELGVLLGHRRVLQDAISTLVEQSSAEPTTAGSLESQRATARSGEAERRQLTVMFCDLVGSSELSQKLDPEDLREVNRAYQDACKAAIERYEGYVARYMGDGVLAYFGYPQAHEDDAERAIHAGLGVVEALLVLNDTVGDKQCVELGVRVGVATGPVVVGDLIGEGASQESAVVGETPNLAARLQALALPNTVVVSPGTHELVAGRFECHDLGAQELKGIAEPVHAWGVRAPTTAESRFEAAHRTGLTPLVGREHEIGLLLERWEQAKEGDGQVVLLSGEAGIGKSRITETLQERTARDAPIRLRYQCSPYHTNSALHPIIQQLERAAQFDSEDTDETKLDKLGALLAQATVDVEAVTPLFSALLSIPAGDHRDPPLPATTPEQQKEQTLEALVAQMEGLSRRQPVLLIFEDFHWADPTSLELLEFIINRAQSVQVLVVITFRPEFPPPWSGHTHVTSLTLNRFTRNLATMMVVKITGGKTLPEGALEQIIEKTDGVPLFVEELTKTILESGLLTEEPNRYVASGPLPEVAIPTTLYDSLMARLDRLGPVKEVAQIAAAVGREFSYDLLAGVSPLEDDELQDALDQLVAANLVFRRGRLQEGAYIFKHALVQDAAYESLLKTRRRQLHGSIANVLEEGFPESIEAEPELLAHHFTEAGLQKPALRYWLKAGERANQRCGHSEAIAHLQRGLGLLETQSESETKVRDEIGFRVALGVPLMNKEGAASQVVVENYRRAQVLCEQAGEMEQLYPILWGVWFHHFLKSELRQARELADRLLEISQNLNHEDLRVEAHHCQWSTGIMMGGLTAALNHCEEGIKLYRAEVHHAMTFTYGGHDPGVCARQCSGLALWLMGYPEQAQERFKSVFDLARELGHSATLADSLMVVGQLFSLQRDKDALEQQAEEFLEFATAENMQNYQFLANGWRGWVMFQRGDVQAGLSLMRESVGPWLEQGTSWTAVPLLLVAESLAQTGEVEEGLKIVDEVLRLGQSEEVSCWEAEVHRVKGELLLKADPNATSGAEDSFKRSIVVAQGQDAKSLELRAVTRIARLYRDQGKRNEAKDRLAPVYDWFTEGFDTADLKEAKTVLDELA